VQFKAPLRAGDVVEAAGTITRVGTRSRTIDFECRVVCRGRPDESESAADVLDPVVVAVTATGTVVVAPTGNPVTCPGRLRGCRLHLHQGGLVDLADGALVATASHRTTVDTDVLHGLDAAVAAACAAAG
jgi:hypothetical protein